LGTLGLGDEIDPGAPAREDRPKRERGIRRAGAQETARGEDIVNNARTVGILVFDEVEVLDFAGPFEVFSVAGHPDGRELFRALLVAEAPGPVRARHGFSVNPHHTFADCPDLDLVVVPGGYGTRREIENEAVLEWIRDVAGSAELVLSVCTGSLLLGRVGLLDGLAATTHHSAFDRLQAVAPRARVDRERRVVDNGRVIVSAGVSAGIDMAFHVVERLHGRSVADQTARYMEYERERGRGAGS
jgi:transcriptional regulator GlxA family with amidase domain